MSLNNIQLGPGLLVDLYSTTLVDGGAISKPVPAPVRFLGKNLKNILIVSYAEDAAFLSERSFTFLSSILSACKLTMDDVALVNWNHCQDMSEALMAETKPAKVFLFDVNPVTFGLPINFPHFQIQEFSGRTYLYTPSLEEVESDMAIKKQLWLSLKRLLNLS
jgi:hypothetical protein